MPLMLKGRRRSIRKNLKDNFKSLDVLLLPTRVGPENVLPASDSRIYTTGNITQIRKAIKELRATLRQIENLT